MTDKLRLGFLRLTDAAPVIMAQEKGCFAENGLDVQLSVEPSWANIADKLAFGQLDGAVILPPLALAMAAGLRGKPVPITVPMGISVNGNTITVRQEVAEKLGQTGDALEMGHRFAAWLRTSGRKARLAVVHVFSTHNLLLRYWLAAAGIDAERDVEIEILPPSETADALRKGTIDGFCAGAPWGAVAEAGGTGRTVAFTSQIWRNHPEKCLAMRYMDDPALQARAVSAVLEGARYCCNPANNHEIAATLARAEYLELDTRVIAASLGAARGPEAAPVFAPEIASVPFREHALWFLGQMVRWGHMTKFDATAVADKVYRPATVLGDVAEGRGEEFFCDWALPLPKLSALPPELQPQQAKTR